jgi:hypothetical protein
VGLIFPLLLIVVVGLMIAFTAPAGMWGNAIRLVNVVTAAVLATNFFEPLAAWLTRSAPSGVFVWDMFSIWILFGAIFAGLHTATEFVSRVRVRFPKPVEMAGNYFFAAWTGWVLICFTTMTLHMAPLGREFLFGGFKAESPMFFGFYPDRMWLGFVQRLSLGSFGRSGTSTDPEAHVFDPRGEYLMKYAERRAQFERQDGLLAQQPGAK